MRAPELTIDLTAKHEPHASTRLPEHTSPWHGHRTSTHRVVAHSTTSEHSSNSRISRSQIQSHQYLQQVKMRTIKDETNLAKPRPVVPFPVGGRLPSSQETLCGAEQPDKVYVHLMDGMHVLQRQKQQHCSRRRCKSKALQEPRTCKSWVQCFALYCTAAVDIAGRRG